MQDHPVIDLFIVGAQKAFTTSLKHYLGEHPAIIAPPQQEMAYFVDDREYKLGYKRALSHYYKNSINVTGKKRIAKNAILYLSEKAIERLHNHNPNCKIVLNLRNPVDRAYSAYLLESNFAQVNFSFDEIKDIATKADNTYWPYTLFIDSGNYAKHLKNIYKYFPKEQVRVVLYEEMVEDPLNVCKGLFKWLNIDDSFSPEMVIHNPTTKHASKNYAWFLSRVIKRDSLPRKFAQVFIPSHYRHKIGNTFKNLNKTSAKHPPMDAETRRFLLDYFSNSNKELEEIIGKKVTTFWSK